MKNDHYHKRQLCRLLKRLRLKSAQSVYGGNVRISLNGVNVGFADDYEAASSLGPIITLGKFEVTEIVDDKV